MRHTILILVLLLSTVALIDAATAQTPEFKLNMSLSNGTQTRHTAFGYDSRSTDNYLNHFDSTFDTLFPPFLDDDFLLVNQDQSFSGSSLNVYIRQKPTVDSFSLGFQWSLQMSTRPDTIRWDRSTIPSQIRHILVSPTASPKQVILDLVNQSSFILTDSNNEYYAADSVYIYYNEEPLAVENAPTHSHSLVTNLNAYPNPFSTHTQIGYTLSHSANVHLWMYDQCGRIIAEKNEEGVPGTNRLELNDFGNDLHDALYVRVQASTSNSSEVQTLTLMCQ